MEYNFETDFTKRLACCSSYCLGPSAGTAIVGSLLCKPVFYTLVTALDLMNPAIAVVLP